MKRNIVVGSLIIFIFLFVPCYAYASLTELPKINIESYGNIVYEDENGSVEIYAEDIAFLQEKLSSIPEEIFNPAFYSRIHDWKYIDVNEKNHTKQCDVCGTTITNEHKAIDQEECSFTYNNVTYDGYSFTCSCGYVWYGEQNHNYVYTSLDEEKHMVSCALDGTSYCEGMKEYEEEHVLNTVSSTDSTHKVLCSICLSEREENCNFIIHFHDDVTGEDHLSCECGNDIAVEEEPEPTPEPELTHEPALIPENEPIHESELTQELKPIDESEPTLEPEPTPEPEHDQEIDGSISANDIEMQN